MKTRFSRTLLMIAGICTVIVVLLSQSVFRPDGRAAGHSKKDQKTEKHIAVAPDVVTSPAIQLDKNVPSLLKLSTPERLTEKHFFPDHRVFVRLVQALLKAAISPNAP
jgi:hypothetical protein